MDCHREKFGENFCYGACSELEIAVRGSVHLFDDELGEFKERFAEVYLESQKLGELEKTAYFWDKFKGLIEELPSLENLRGFTHSENAYLNKVVRHYSEAGDTQMVDWLNSLQLGYEG